MAFSRSPPRLSTTSSWARLSAAPMSAASTSRTTSRSAMRHDDHTGSRPCPRGRFWQNLRPCAGYRGQYLATLEPQRRLAPHVHTAIRGAIPRQVLRTARLPVWTDRGCADPTTGELLPTWAEGLDASRPTPRRNRPTGTRWRPPVASASGTRTAWRVRSSRPDDRSRVARVWPNGGHAFTRLRVSREYAR